MLSIFLLAVVVLLLYLWEGAASPTFNIPINLAWILAACEDRNVRNPDESIRVAEHACKVTRHKSAALLDTLAAAYAAAGRFTEAEATAQKALELAVHSGQKEMAEEIRKRMEAYDAGRPYQDQPKPRPGS